MTLIQKHVSRACGAVSAVLPVLAALLLSGTVCRAQNVSVSTNVVMLADFGTPNLEMGFSVGPKASLHVGGRYNNWTFRPDDPLLNRKRTVWAGVRWWSWNVNSGFFIQGKFQYQEYNRNVLMKGLKEQGDAFGVGLGAGYAVMLSRHFNIEFGAHFWAGMTKYGTYDAAIGGYYVDSGTKFFALPDDLCLSFVYIFGPSRPSPKAK